MFTPLSDREEDIRATEQEIHKMTCELLRELEFVQKIAKALHKKSWHLQTLETLISDDTAS